MNDTILKSFFDKFNKDKSGNLVYSEFVEIINRLSKHVPELHDVSNKDLRGVFKLIDENSDNYIKFKEFNKWWNREDKYDLIVGKNSELLLKAFDLYISYARGNKMTIDEFTDMMEDLEISFSEDGYENLDTSLDGTLNFQEFCNWLNWF